jgi:hypothetical protein
MRDSDFTFVHRVLIFARLRAEFLGSFAEAYSSVPSSDYVILLKYGPVYLGRREFEERCHAEHRAYYRALAWNTVRRREARVLRYQRETLQPFGTRIDQVLFAKAIVAETARCLMQPAFGLFAGYRRA